jgi:hypothetical protein
MSLVQEQPQEAGDNHQHDGAVNHRTLAFALNFGAGFFAFGFGLNLATNAARLPFCFCLACICHLTSHAIVRRRPHLIGCLPLTPPCPVIPLIVHDVPGVFPALAPHRLAAGEHGEGAAQHRPVRATNISAGDDGGSIIS